MSYAIIRNVKYKGENLKEIYRHNERKNYNYSNRNIDKENKALHKELSRQANIVDDAEKYQIERESIIADNKALHNKVDKLECKYKNKSIELEFNYKDKYERLENENNKLRDFIQLLFYLSNRYAINLLLVIQEKL